jgi:hypothetical protein
MYFGEVLMNKGNCSPRINHGIDGEGGPLEIQSDRNGDGSGVIDRVVNRRNIEKLA